MRKLIMLCAILIFSVQLLTPQTPRDTQRFLSDALADMERAFSQNEFIPQDEYYLGRAVAANILANYRPYTRNPDLTRYLNLICQTIVVNSIQPTIFKGYFVMILDSPELNAFATPGGHIFLTRGLVELATSEDMLAAIIAHELVHIMLRHGIDTIEDMRLFDEMAIMAERGAALSGNTEAATRTLNFRNSISSVIDLLVRNGYSQFQEFEADQEAAALLAASGYNPQALVDMLVLMDHHPDYRIRGFSSTHPSPRDRIISVEPHIRRYRVQDTSHYRELRFRNR